MHKAQTVICGAGIMGLTIARELLSRGHGDILIIEKEPHTGAHASGRNSGVLHAGIYYAPGSARAKTCMEGNRLMREYCREKSLPLGENGKVIVTTAPEQLAVLDELHRRALANGADVRMVDEHELADIEPHAKTIDRALHSPRTAVVDPRAILKSLADDLTATGRVRLFLDTRAIGPRPDGRLDTTAGPVAFGHLINAMGAHADTLAHAFGIGLDYCFVPFKGAYRQLAPARAELVRGSIYPVPDIRNPFLGVHFTRGVHGDVYIGPTATPAFGRENYHGIDGIGREGLSILMRDATLFAANPKFRSLAVDEVRRMVFACFFREAQRLVKGLEPTDILPCAKVGIRPQLVDTRTNELVSDFLVLGTGNSTHILNSISPAFTSSMAFARIIADDHLPATV
ncbi:L-2-hydroxyglutarate oxidase LhgO [Desulfobaculum xiamenense]|uniref:L-2-hydroxyglutarate oxidase LhgO n=1 Tax=Desulfobaculum xiamenense TaxID=995050 RepID=A0A846QL03_9BACT|nr:L-2-hydroxyglutarate oxidase [Desulfobaculum xiamenense]NJB68858.1 L-2-hydroxyglutarate oxidase LhgO [Desulfobaculum xiamenense]